MNSVQGVEILEVKPTVFLVEKQGLPYHAIDLKLKCSAPISQLTVNASLERGSFSETHLSSIPDGESVHRLWIPECTTSGPLTLKASYDGRTTTRIVDWRSPKRWTVYVVHTAHFDPGYTGLPSTVMEEYLDYLDQVVDYCDQTSDWPYESRFRYTVEQSWIALHYLVNRDGSRVDRFVRYCREGRIQINAMYGNMILELLGSEEMARLLYPAFRLKAKYGIPIRCAHNNDIPGFAWGLTSVLTSAGVKYFIPGLPDYFTWRGKAYRNYWDDKLLRPGGAPSFFHWEAPNGRKILVHAHTQGAGGLLDPSLQAVVPFLEDLQRKGYPYDFARCLYNGGFRDNAPPLLGISIAARQWNSQYLSPRIIVANDLLFMDECESRLGKLPTYRGDLPGTDYGVGATSTAASLAVSREATDMLLSAERLATLADSLTDYPYPQKRLNLAYDNLLRFDEHTWGVARPLGPAEDASLAEFALYAQRARCWAHTELYRVTNRIADNIRINPKHGLHLVIFNPTETSRSDVSSAPFASTLPADMSIFPLLPNPTSDAKTPVFMGSWAYGRAQWEMNPEWIDGCFDLIDCATEQKVKYQIVKLDSAFEPTPDAGYRASLGMDMPEFKHTLEFIAKDIPPLGYRTYRVVPRSSPPRFVVKVRASRDRLENDFYRIKIDPKSGVVTSILDKELKRELVDVNSGVGFNQLIARNVLDGKITYPEKSRVQIKRRGACSASLLIIGRAPGCPQRAQEIVLYDGIKRIDFHNRILKDARADQQIHYAFPFSVQNPKFRYEAPMTSIEPITDQLPGSCTDYYAVQGWAAVSEGSGAFTILWSSPHAPMVRFSELWPDYVSQAHHNVTSPSFEHDWLTDPKQFRLGHIYSYLLTNNFRTNFAPSQVGDLLASYSLTSHSGDFSFQTARSFSDQATIPLPCAIMNGDGLARPGHLPLVGHFVEITGLNMELLTIKRAENGEGVIVRLLNHSTQPERVSIRLPFLKKVSAAILCNVVEEPVGGILEMSAENVATLVIGPKDTSTVWFKQ